MTSAPKIVASEPTMIMPAATTSQKVRWLRETSGMGARRYSAPEKAWRDKKIPCSLCEGANAMGTEEKGTQEYDV